MAPLQFSLSLNITNKDSSRLKFLNQRWGYGTHDVDDHPTLLQCALKGSLTTKLLEVWCLFDASECSSELASDTNTLMSTSEALLSGINIDVLEGCWPLLIASSP